MSKIDLKNLTPEGAKQVVQILKKEVQSLKNDKSRLIREGNTLQEGINKLFEEKKGLAKFIAAEKEKLMLGIKKKEDILDQKIKDQNAEHATTSAKNGELDEAIKANKKAEANYNRQANTAKSEAEKSETVRTTLEEIVKIIQDKLKEI